MTEGVQDADIVLLCVGTPSRTNGDVSLEHLSRVCLEIASSLDSRSRRLVVAVRSTVFPGSCEEVVIPALKRHSSVSVVANPEFLREGCALTDFMAPSLLVVGCGDETAVRAAAALDAGCTVAACLLSLR